MTLHPTPADCREPWCPYIDGCPDTCGHIRAMLAQPQLTDVDYEYFVGLDCTTMTMGR